MRGGNVCVIIAVCQNEKKKNVEGNKQHKFKKDYFHLRDFIGLNELKINYIFLLIFLFSFKNGYTYTFLLSLTL